MEDAAAETESMAQLILDPDRGEAKIVVKTAAVDLRAVDPVEKLLHEAATARVQRLELDLAGVSFADSSVVRLALRARELAEGAQVVIKAPPDVRRVFDLTETSRLFEMVASDSSD
jgi:anti-anti-sigma factor